MNLALMNVDLALRVEMPEKPTEKSSAGEKADYDRWEHSNRCCLMVMRYHMEESVSDSIPETMTAKALLAAIAKKYAKFDKVEKSTYMGLLTSTAYDGTSGVREHVMKLTSYYYKLKGMNWDPGENFLVWQILQSLPEKFDTLRTSSTLRRMSGLWMS
ncbi:hypothetical protein L484_012673 [Morus notabilis]|uniref:Retrovirus-related Pol polyprotein from transposon TNT 1-94 n=1 Tax=Morus notabilis TaxID=981085 RepID=W9QD12_9ROSA|nr:hypothetical protein L484_012673 [Morus notabilis]